MNGVIGPVKQGRDLIDAEQGIGVQNEGHEELAGGEFCVIEWRPKGVGTHESAATAPDTVEIVPRSDSCCTTLWTGSLFPDGLETPLDVTVERLGAKLQSPKRNKLLNCTSAV